jgi:fatty acid/phospholipid biosynthesis enzyme
LGSLLDVGANKEFDSLYNNVSFCFRGSLFESDSLSYQGSLLDVGANKEFDSLTLIRF